MARQTNGTNQSLQSASALAYSSTNLLTISFWLWWDSFANDDQIALESSSNYNSGADGAVRFLINPNDSTSGKFMFGVKGVGYNKAEITRPSAGAHHHYMVTLDLTAAVNEIVNIYLNGVDEVPASRTATTNNTGPFGDQVLNLMARNNASLWADGRISEVAIWGGINLTAGNAASLAAGVLPSTIESGNLIYYWKLCGVNSPELPTVGSINLTVNGATQVAHPSAVAGSCDTPITGLRPAICL